MTRLTLLGCVLLAVYSLSACSQAVDSVEAPAVPQAVTPEVGQEAAKGHEKPQSSTDILRITDIDFPSYSRDLARFVGLELGQTMAEATTKIETYFTPTGGDMDDMDEYWDPDSNIPKTESEFSTLGGEGGKVTVVERVNMKDDSVRDEQFYAIFKQSGEAYTLADYGMKIRCYRGENTDEWQTELCP